MNGAEFIGYQEDGKGGRIALYNVMDPKSPIYHSTVSAETLRKHGIVVPYDPEQLAMGIKVEMEHTTDPAIAEKIAKDHLNEIPDYYTRLKKMEDEAGVKSNPSNKSYTGDKKVKAVGKTVNPRPGMMIAVNPSERKNPALLVINPKEKVKVYDNGGKTIDRYTVIIDKYVYTMSIDANSPQGINQYAGELKDLPGAKQGRLVPVKSLPAGVQQAISARLHSFRSYLPPMGKENPSKLDRWHERLDRHYKMLERLAAKVGLKNADGKKLSVALLKLENQARKAATDYANGDIDSDQMDKIDVEVTGKVFKLFGKLPGFFVNTDPRGYALKIDDKFMPRYENVGIERDMGGYGILSPEISKENPAKKNPANINQILLLESKASDIPRNAIGYIIALQSPTLVKSVEIDSLKMLERHIPGITEQWYRYGKIKSNPMVKDMTSKKQKRQIRQDVKAMAGGPGRKMHQEFASLEAAAEWVDKNIAPVKRIIKGNRSHSIIHEKGISIASKTSNHKIVIL